LPGASQRRKTRPLSYLADFEDRFGLGDDNLDSPQSLVLESPPVRNI
jgi:hypothetical protein